MSHSLPPSVVRPSLRDLLDGITRDAEVLLSQTAALARLEASTLASKLVWAGVGVAAGVLAVAAGVAVLIAALVLGIIALGLPPWAAALVVGLVLLGSGALAGRYFIGVIGQLEFRLKDTRESLHETIEWLKSQTRA